GAERSGAHGARVRRHDGGARRGRDGARGLTVRFLGLPNGRSVTNASTNEAAVRRAFRAHRALVIDRQAASHEPLAVPTPRRGRSRVSLRAASFGVPRLGPRSPEAGCTELAYGLQDALHVRIRESERLR